jgi:GNAT superfamily N-acetyltransferase
MMRRVLDAWAADAAAFAAVLRAQDPSWGSNTFPLAGGHVVLCGAGMCVNRAIGVGLDRPLTVADFDLLERRSSAAGVAPAIEVSPLTHPVVLREAGARGFVGDSKVVASRRGLSDIAALPVDASFVIEPAADQLRVWQETSAAGWRHDRTSARRASDAFAAAAAAVDGDGFVLARDADDGRPVGCASLTMRDGVATLGGMSTIPSERRRGVQAALIRHRLRLAAANGCVVATTTASPGGDSERNLRRHGFEPWFEVETLVGPGGSGGR